MNNPKNIVLVRAIQLLILVSVMSCASVFVSDGKEEAIMKKNAAKSVHFPQSKSYQTECTSCHIGFLPGFLPDRSWKKLMAGLEDHFGENASLDDAVRTEITKFLSLNAADMAASSPRSKRIAKMIPAHESPIRITETPFWKRKHSSIKEYVWKRAKVGHKSNCESCHRDAAKGLYSEHDVNVPK